MRGVGGITLFLQNPSALLSEQVTSGKKRGAFLLGPLASENIGRGKGWGVSSRGWVWWEQFSLQTVTPTAMPAFMPARPWPQLGWLPRMAKDYFSPLLPRNSGVGLSKYFVTYKS